MAGQVRNTDAAAFQPAAMGGTNHRGGKDQDMGAVTNIVWGS